MSDPLAGADAGRTILVGSTPMALAEAQRRIRVSATWFWWVAGLSVINSLATILDLKYAMVVGLGLGQMIDGLFYLDFDGARTDPGMTARAIHMALSATIAGVFVVLGYFARRASGAAFVVGMVLYALDSLLFVLVGDWIAVGFHGFVLFMLFGGLSILQAVRRQVPADTAAL